ncbi:hypothetical protein [Sinorhizobium meliloti]|uniref:hypothetical protein n=1 Tax=Rhizobium meliloti TaxID=382 RepID=UPI000518C5C8|nr:hypothetical protein [Sinorhizobium meliloti]MDE4620835.1 hypothetical protein [Sinorhizobium meliloti]RVK96138.1 hypothetical protein CN152_19800 [Sinorhizobium meliloti]RVN50949.1 hypothetical protein CN113_04080 [Sinorhizobium meliloti]
MFADISELHKAIVEKRPADFVSHFLFEPTPFVFNKDFAGWIHWKSELATRLDVDPKDIVLTGSAALGYSLNPHKHFKAFDERSDVDCGIISAHHFDVAWRHLRRLRPQWLMLPRASRQAITIHRENYIFTGTVATDKILSILPFGPQWKAALEAMATREPTVNRDVKLRIYKDYDALRQYHAHNVGRLRDTLLHEAAETELETET